MSSGPWAAWPRPVTDHGGHSPYSSPTPRRQAALDQHLPVALKITCDFEDKDPRGNNRGSDTHTPWSVG